MTMTRIATSLLALAAATAPALAGGDWDDDDYHEYESWRGGYRTYHVAPAYPSEVYIPYGYYFADEPEHPYGANCKVERKWKRGHYKEKIECEDDDD